MTEEEFRQGHTQPKPLQIEEGKWYRNADGEVYGPAIKLQYSGGTFQWNLSDFFFRDDGGYLTIGTSENDLVAEVPAPVEQSERAKQVALEQMTYNKEHEAAVLLGIKAAKGPVCDPTFGGAWDHPGGPAPGPQPEEYAKGMAQEVQAEHPPITEDSELSAIRAVLGLDPDAQKRVVGYLVDRIDL